jgi:hypothetical protein
MEPRIRGLLEEAFDVEEERFNTIPIRLSNEVRVELSLSYFRGVFETAIFLEFERKPSEKEKQEFLQWSKKARDKLEHCLVDVMEEISR